MKLQHNLVKLVREVSVAGPQGLNPGPPAPEAGTYGFLSHSNSFVWDKPDKFYTYYLESITEGAISAISPGATVETYLFYGLQPGEEPAKLHVIAKSLTGNVLEFDIMLK